LTLIVLLDSQTHDQASYNLSQQRIQGETQRITLVGRRRGAPTDDETPVNVQGLRHDQSASRPPQHSTAPG